MVVGQTDIGLQRQMNQDVFSCGDLDAASSYAVVCDGMGGENAGNVASQMACDIISNRIRIGYREGVDQNSVRNLLITAVTAANTEVRRSAQENSDFEGMGTTVVAAFVKNRTLHIAHVGDSRAYVVNENEFTQLTRDHSLVQELLEAGKISDEDAKNHPQKNLITRAVGVDSRIRIDYLETVLDPGDRVLICTDGLTNNCEEDEIHRTVVGFPLEEIPQKLIDLANNAGGPDNITVVLLAENHTEGLGRVMDKYVGKRLDGRYEITELIGVGGMANVYKANDILEGTVVAVKILKEEFSKNSEFLRRFKNESKAIALLSHPNIVRVVDVSFGDRIQYIVMEYVSGITLKQYIEQQGVLTWKEAVHFTVQVLRALQHAHDNGIVHRDVKPQNIMLLQDGTIKVMDFGIARFARGDSKTVTDKAIGSVHYISPEQARGDEIDEKTDIYSVGVMLYEMLTGQLPFEADNAVSVAIMQMQSPFRKPREVNETIPEGLEEITIRAMQKNPAKRYQSAAEMLRDIDEFKHNPSIVFEYKYFGDDDATKYFDAIAAANKEEDFDEVEEKKSHLIPILAGVAVAFVAVAIIVCVAIFGLSDIFEKVPDIEVPNLIGEVYEDALSDPRFSDFVIERKNTEYSDKYDAGIIIDQEEPEGRRIKKGQVVYVTVSRGLGMIDIPDIVGKPYDEAETELMNAGLIPVRVEQIDETVTVGNVIQTDPPIGTQVNADSEVRVYVSMGNVEQPIYVPRLIGRDYSQAEALLLNMKLKVEKKEVDSTEPEGTVIAQSIAEGSKVSEATLIVLDVSSGKPEEVTVKFAEKIPASASKNYKYFTFTVLLDGVVKQSETVNVTAAQTYSFELTESGDGSHDVRIMVVPQGSSEAEKCFVQYDVDFEMGSKQVVSREAGVFASFAPPKPSESSSSESSSSESSSSESEG